MGIQYYDGWPPIHPRYRSGMTPEEYHEKFLKPYGIPYREEIPKKTVKDLQDPLLSYFDIHMIYDNYTKEGRTLFNSRVKRFEEILDEIGGLELEFENVKKYRESNINHVKVEMNCLLAQGITFNASFAQHDIEIQLNELRRTELIFKDKMAKLVAELQDLDERMVKFVEWCDVPRSEIERFCRERFHKDVTKPIPHQCALQDPLYHDAATDDMGWFGI